MNKLFPPELRTAAVVRRWSIVRVHNRDNIAEHSFFVTCYALAIARLLEWKGSLADLMFVAMMHDAEEFITGDMVSPVKHAVLDEAKFDRFVSEQMFIRLPLVATQLETIMESELGDHIEAIVKVADKVDAVIFLILEQRGGNQAVAPLYQDALNNLQAAWAKLIALLGGTPELEGRLWGNEIWPAIQAHWRYGSIGLT